MVEIKGKYTSAKIYSEDKDKNVFDDIRRLCNQPCMDKQTICVMPDLHECNGIVVGTTVTCGSEVIPSLLGRDIGCGILATEIKTKSVDFSKLDKVIREGEKAAHQLSFLPKLYAKIDVAWYAGKEFATLGHGNHFMELDKDEEGNLYFLIHSGSRSLGRAMADYYQRVAKTELSFLEKHHRPNSLLPLSEYQTQKYLHDVKQVQQYASSSRYAMLVYIAEAMNWELGSSLETVHNYYDTESNILRKGAVSAKLGEKLIIPLNMRDGALLCVGKGNDAWNKSAPHGCGRVQSRSEARKTLNFAEYQESMQGIYSTSVCNASLEEAPMCYKSAEKIVQAIGETVEIKTRLKPMYNYKNID